jgi:hypothetical protein
MKTLMRNLLILGAFCVFGVPAWAQWTIGSGGAIYYNGGNVGIGTASPGNNLDVVGTVHSGGTGAALFSSDRTDGSVWGFYGQNSVARIWNSGTGDLLYFNKSGYLGLGTGGPLAKLHSTVGAASTGKIAALIYGSTGTGTFTDEVGHSHALATFVVGSNWFSNSNGSLVNVYSAAGDGLLFVGAGGNVGVGTTNPQSRLSVHGTIQAKEVIVNTGWSDYVFTPSYHPPSLESTADYIRAHHHLPGMPTAKEVKEKGVSVGDVEAKLLAKVEELTLQMIELNENVKELKASNTELKARLASQQKQSEEKQ